MNLQHYLPFFGGLLLVIVLYFSGLSDWLLTTVALDKLGHFIGFFFLTWLIYLIANKALLTVGLLLIFYSGLTELGQYTLGFRNGDVGDFIADAIGVVSFVCLQGLARLISQNKTRKINP